MAAEDVLNAKPVGSSYYGAEVARVLHTIKAEAKFFGYGCGRFCIYAIGSGNVEDAYHFLWMLQKAALTQFFISNLYVFSSLKRFVASPFWSGNNQLGVESLLKQFSYTFESFCNEGILFLAVFLVAERLYVFDFVFA
jgi:hypothetical protein